MAVTIGMLYVPTVASAAERAVRKLPVAPAAAVVKHVPDWSAFYDPY
jgi:hypothetical protein